MTDAFRVPVNWRPARWLGLICVLVFALSGCGRSRDAPRDVPVPVTLSPNSASAGSSGHARDLADDVDDDVEDTGYVDDAACAECHGEIAASYSRHPMGRSLATTAKAEVIESYEGGETNSFSTGRFLYEVRRDAEQTVHRQLRIGLDDALVAEIAEPVRFAIGSGRQGRSYVINRDGYLFLSPITWYASKRRWDLSPGYETKNSEFNRPVTAGCLFCHANRALHLADTLNRYQQPVFAGHAIGCQRCHGPGAAHMRRHGPEAATDMPETIVNPARLRPALREAVCHQCHLSGLVRVTRQNRQLTDFRPGTSLETYLSVFVLKTPIQDKEEFVGQVEQLHASRCFQASDGRLGCISCHDPHSLPSSGQRIDYYRDRCLECHDQHPCALPAERRVEEAGDSCINCHMPARPTEVRHAATSDHRIVRFRERPEHLADTPAETDDGALPLRPFSAFGEPADSQSRRDMAIAVMAALDAHPELIATPHVELARDILESASRLAPDDLDALESLAQARWQLGQTEGALEALKRVLQQRPGREFSVVMAAEVLGSTGDGRQAVGAWQAAIGTNPWMARYWYSLALAHARLNSWSQCRQVAQQAAARFPTSVGAKYLLVESNLQLGNQQEAEECFRALEEFAPGELSELRAWFARHPLNRK